MALGCSSSAGSDDSNAMANVGAGGAAGGTTSNGVAGQMAMPAAGNGGLAAGGSGAATAGGGNAGSTGGASGANTAGAAGSNTGGASSIDAVRMSAGCTLAADIAPGDYQQSTLEGRSIWVRLPDGYDPNRAYPLIFVWKGCGGAGALSIFHMEEVAGGGGGPL